MAEASISHDLALRIGLAARALPDTDPKRLIEVLADCVGLPPDEHKLSSLKLKDLREALDGELAEIPAEALKAALAILKDNLSDDPESSDPAAPAVTPYQEGDMPGSIRIACASNGYTELDGHFGSCARFMVYQVSKDEARLIDIRAAKAPKSTLSDDKNAFRAQLIKDCDVMYVASIGGPAAAKVVKAGIHPIKLATNDPLEDILARLQTVLAGSPPPWLAKVMGIAAEDRVRFDVEDSE